MGTAAPAPVTGLVLLPPFALVKSTELLNVPTLVGVNRTVTLVEPPAATLMVLPATMLNGAPTVATPLLTGVPPVLLTTNTACIVVPVAIVPKLIEGGLTPMSPGVNPTP